ALDVRNQCSGFLYSLSPAHAWIKSGVSKRVLIVVSEILSNRINKSPLVRDVGVIFGDGAGDCIVVATCEDTGIQDIHIASQGQYADALCLKEPGANITADQMKNMSHEDLIEKGFFPNMEGKLVFKNAIERMCESLGALLQKNN